MMRRRSKIPEQRKVYVVLGKVTRSYSLKTKFFVILSEVEESHNSKRKAISLWFFMRLTKKISCFDYAEHEDYANATGKNIGFFWQ